MERLFNSVQLMLSRTRGALYLAVLFVSTIFAAATGIVGASVTILGIMAAKTMNVLAIMYAWRLELSPQAVPLAF